MYVCESMELHHLPCSETSLRRDNDNRLSQARSHLSPNATDGLVGCNDQDRYFRQQWKMADEDPPATDSLESHVRKRKFQTGSGLAPLIYNCNLSHPPRSYDSDLDLVIGARMEIRKVAIVGVIM